MTKSNLKAVAAVAGVSTSTVSRYLNGTLSLSEDTELRVIQAVDQTGYERQRRKPSTDANRRRVMGLLMPEVGNQYFGAIADAIVEAAEQQGFSVVIGSTLNHSRKQAKYVDLLSNLSVDGLLYIGNFPSNDALAGVISSGMPVVVVDEAQEGVPSVDSVLADDYSGAYQAVSYLTNLGHRRIALATGPADLHSVKERRRGYRDVLEKAGIDADDQLDIVGSFSDEFGAAVLTQILASKSRPTAVFAASDIIAIGLMVAARTLGVRIPEDLSVVGFDDIQTAQYVTPRLTTVRTPLDETARAAVSLLAERLESPQRKPREEVVSVALVVRESATREPPVA